MNKATAERYEIIGKILAMIAAQKTFTPLERAMADELYQYDKAFCTAIKLLRILHSSDQPISLNEIAARFNVSFETAKVIVRSLKKGGFKFDESTQPLQGTGGRILLFNLTLKDSMLTYFLHIKGQSRKNVHP